MYGFDSINSLFTLSQTNEQGAMHVQFELRKNRSQMKESLANATLLKHKLRVHKFDFDKLRTGNTHNSNLQ